MSSKVREFLKAQLSAFIGGLSDFAIYTFCYKILLLSAPFSNVVSGSLGAVVNFTINRYWAFNNVHGSVTAQLWKFIVVVVGSILLKSAGIYFLVDIYKAHYLLSKVLVEIIVSLCFNFVLQKYWVFRKG